MSLENDSSSKPSVWESLKRRLSKSPATQRWRSNTLPENWESTPLSSLLDSSKPSPPKPSKSQWVAWADSPLGRAYLELLRQEEAKALHNLQNSQPLDPQALLRLQGRSRQASRARKVFSSLMTHGSTDPDTD
jgi:hypothetical protein